MSMIFTKMQALGNDFVVLDATQQPFSMTSQQIQRMGNRHRGIGFDQLLVIEPSQTTTSDFYYRIFNADGTEVGQCGNGARCVALYIKQHQLSNKDNIVLQTRTAQLKCQLLSDGRVCVQMPPPKFDAADIPFDASQIAATDVAFNLVNVGNPHAIIKVDDVEAADLAGWGAAMATDTRFPEGVNISVAQICDRNTVRLRVFERGVGETEACGSAACAVMASGYQQGWLDSQVVVSQPGGDLTIGWQGADSNIEMTGPAEFIFSGRYFLL